MSTQYIGVAERPHELDLDNLDSCLPINIDDVVGGLLALGFTEEDAVDPAFFAGLSDRAASRLQRTRQFTWERDDGFIQAAVCPTDVSIEHGSGGDEHLQLLQGVLATLELAGLFVWDPQTSTWLR